jgi:hypothetical protein
MEFDENKLQIKRKDGDFGNLFPFKAALFL